MIELKNVSKFYNDNNIVTVGLKNVSLKLNKGEFVAITGDSGSGKSTLLNVISSIDIYDEGEILYYGNETFYFNQNDSDTFRKNNVSFIFQKYNIVDSYTVLENVMLPLLIKGKSEEEAKAEALEIIKRVGLEHRAYNKGTKLSGGEKQRCVIARALATDAPILACDEPTGNLDKKTSAEIINLIREVSKDKLVLIVTHDYDSIKDICTRKIKLSDGEIVEDITLTEGIEEERKELVLEDTKPTKQTLFKLAFLNLRSTPKKTIFSTLVFTFVACLFLLLSLFMVKVSYEENYTYSDSYGIVSEDRAIIYADNHESLDMTKLQPILEDYEYYENAFYEEQVFYVDVSSYGSVDVAVTFHAMDYELINGTDELQAGEFVLVVPNDSYYWYGAFTVGDTISTTPWQYFGETSIDIGTLVGIGTSNEINKMYLVGKPDSKLINMSINNAVQWLYSSEETGLSEMPTGWVSNAEKTEIWAPASFKDKALDLQFNLKNLYGVSYDFDIKYTDDVSEPCLIMGTEFVEGGIAPDFGGVKEISVYTDNIKKLTKNVTALGYDVSIPSMVENQSGASLIVLYLLTIVIVMALVIMFFISFVILQRVYLTKTKDYSIFRTLGLVSTDLKKILNIEVLATTVMAMFAGAILTNVIIIAGKLDLYKYVSVSMMLVYTLTMLVFGVATAYRLNKKIFKFSVYQALKEGGE
ncbi:MAG: ATP-binding cassette domain-containing protein [Clostridiales bacterium]|nr:ATP-binding cassette domain-containing protein [Clostridiales bacterium]